MKKALDPAATSASILPADLPFFVTLARSGSLSAAAREMGVTTAAVSRHLAQMEARLRTPLLNRTTRRMSLTPEGEIYLEHARSILSEMDTMATALGAARGEPQGLLRVNATLGFGRRHIAPAVSAFVRKHPRIEVQLQLSVNPPPLTDDAFDVAVRFGPPPDTRVVAWRLAANRRLLVAAPAYLQAHGTPKTPRDLTRHRCIGIRQGDEAYGVWRLESGRGAKLERQTVHTRGNLSTNDGEIAVQWALDGHGILMRAQWDVAHHLERGRLVQVLEGWRTPDADIYAVVPARLRDAARVRVFIEWLARRFDAGG
jgi:LysR family transcriptional regulator, transcriptional activator for dmlA